MKKLCLILLFGGLFAGCNNKQDTEVEGMKPVYISSYELLQYQQVPPQPIVKAGKIMLYNNYLFLGEINKGIHVIDISDTLNPLKIWFLKIPGNKDIVAQNNRLYADNGPHLLTLNISDINHITLVERQLNIFQPSETYPLDYDGYFECFDETKGWLIEWQKTLIENPQCKAFKQN